MIRIITGDLGAGKTLLSVMEMFEDFCRGDIVVTNVDIVWDEMVKLARRRRRVVLDPAQLVRLDPNETRDWQEVIPFGVPGRPIKCYLDEIHLFYNARNWQKTQKENGDLLSFLSQSRKAAVDITFITQEAKNVDSQFIRMCEYTLYCVSIKHMPVGWIAALPLKVFMVVKRDTKHGNLLGKQWRTYDTAFWKTYRSFDMLDDYMRNLRAKADVRAPLKLARVSRLRVISETVWEAVSGAARGVWGLLTFTKPRKA